MRPRTAQAELKPIYVRPQLDRRQRAALCDWRRAAYCDERKRPNIESRLAPLREAEAAQQRATAAARTQAPQLDLFAEQTP